MAYQKATRWNSPSFLSSQGWWSLAAASEISLKQCSTHRHKDTSMCNNINFLCKSERFSDSYIFIFVGGQFKKSCLNKSLQTAKYCCPLLLMRSLPESFRTSPAPRPWSPALRQHRSLTGGPLRPETHLATSFHVIQVSHMVVCFCYLTQSCPPPKKNGSVFRSKPPKKNSVALTVAKLPFSCPAPCVADAMAPATLTDKTSSQRDERWDCRATEMCGKDAKFGNAKPCSCKRGHNSA